MNPRILIFEDNDMIRTSLQIMLAGQGYHVQVFSHPGMCPQYDCSDRKCLLEESCSDIIISDVHMPVESGLELIANRFKLGCKLKFRALMSADWTESDLQYAQELGCKIFHKPFDLAEILDWVENCHKQLDPIVA